MNPRQRLRKLTSLLTVLAMVIGLWPIMPITPTYASTVTETIAEWNWAAYPTFPADATGGTISGAELGISERVQTTGTFSKDKSISTKNWQGGEQYWLLTIPKQGYSDLKLSFDAYSSGTGPRDFKVQVSTDNVTFVDVPNGEYILGLSSAPYNKKDLSISTSSVNQAEKIYIRLLNTSKEPVTKTPDTQEVKNTGTTRLYNIKITGVPTDGSGPVEDTKVSSVTANIPSGSTVPVGTQIEFSTRTTEAVIYFQLNDEPRTTGSMITLDQDAFIGDTATIIAGATKEGLENSDETIFTYTKKVEDITETISIDQARSSASGAIVQVEGIVTRAIQSSGTSKTNCTLFIQDGTAGIAVYKSGIALDTYTIGQKVRVKGKLSEYNGVLQIQPAVLSDIQVIETEGIKPREPQSITIGELNLLKYEGQLVKIQGVKLDTIATNSNHMIIDELTNAKTTMRCTEDSTLPSTFKEGDIIDVIGVAANFKGTAQILVSKVIDITPGEAAPVAVVTAEPDNNGTVPKGGEVTLSTVTPDAHIIYSLNGNAEQTVEANQAKVKVNEFNQEGNKAVIKAKATNGKYTTPEKTFVYAQAQVPKVVASLPAGAVKPGSVVELTTTPAEATIRYIVTKKQGIVGESSDEEALYTAPIVLTEDMFPVQITAWAIAPGYLDSEKVTFKYRLKATGAMQNYFGQLHSHTAENSDGAGSLVEAYDWAKNQGGLDFFAVTDHSNSFDTAPSGDQPGTYNLGAYNASNVKWQNGKIAAAESCDEDFVGVYAYEMTWSGGPGHMNTFGTEGFVSRNNKVLNNKANDAGLRAYYNLLKDHPESISQFNHPGKTFGTFSGFAYWDPVIDQRVSLIEVGNGEGAVGSGGYFTSYNEYNQALDKGWHLAPTNNQDNHKKGWGSANTARTVIYTDDLSVDGLYQALREMRVYATEDDNLDIVYTLNNEPLGTIMGEVPSQATFNVEVNDPDGSDRIASISIISNGGKAIYTQSYEEQNAILDYTIPNPKAGYYYIKVVQEDGHIAVTAPVWLGQAAAIGITEVRTNAIMPVTTEELTLSTELFNNEQADAVITNIRYQIEGGEVIAELTPNAPIKSNGVYVNNQTFTPTKPGLTNVIVTAVVSLGGQERTFTAQIELDVRAIDNLVFVGVDASHFNEYVSGNYKNSMGNFAKLAAQYNVRVVELPTSQALMEAMKNPKYKMMVFTAPSRRDGTTGRDPYATYSDEEIAAVKAFAQLGKTVIIAGWADYYESYPNVQNDGLENHMAGQQNKLLEAIGSSLRIADDGALDDKNNGGQPPRLYLTDYNGFRSPLTKGIVEGQVYSNYGGATIYAVNADGTPAMALPESIMPIISGHETTYSKDQDKDGFGLEDPKMSIPRYDDRVLITASEDIIYPDNTKTQVIVSGAAFMSNFEIQAEVENSGSLNYSNYNILENIIKTVNPTQILAIQDVKQMPVGTQVTIEGIATSNVYEGSDSNKGFFDCIYMQDETGGINLFPVSQGVQEGQKIRVTGRVSSYQGEIQLQVSKVEVINTEVYPVKPQKVSTAQAMAGENTGKLLEVEGTVQKVVMDQGVVGQIIVDDGSGPALIYINGYITKNRDLSFVQKGKKIRAVGLASIGENFESETDFLPRLRVRDRGEIVDLGSTSGGGGSSDGGSTTGSSVAPNPPAHQVETADDQVKITIAIPTPMTGDPIVLSDAVVKAALKDLEKLGLDKTSNILVVNVPGANQDIVLHLSKEAVELMQGSKLHKVELHTALGTLVLGQDVLKVLVAQTKGDFKISISPLKVNQYGDRPGVDIQIVGGGTVITTFDGTMLSVALPYMLQDGEKATNIVIHAINEQGAYKLVKNGKYDIANENIIFETPHLSKYVVGYNDVRFSDVKENVWYSEAIDFIAARGIIKGIGEQKFAPDKVLTRAEFIMMLMRAYDLQGDGSEKDNFNNVPISRQDLFVMLYNVLQATNNLPESKGKLEGKDFSDWGEVEGYAIPAIDLFIKAEVVKGNNGQIMPQDFATRAYAAQLIYNIMR